MSRPVPGRHGSETKFEAVECQRDGCQFWISVYSTEGLKQSPECSFVLQALTNNNGLLVV
jgi:hypothetical protein